MGIGRSVLGLIRIFVVLAGLLTAVQAGASPLIHNSDNLPDPVNPKWGGSWGVAGGKYGAFTCATCHIETTTNIKRVVNSIPDNIGPTSTGGKPVYFQNVTGFGNDVGGHTTSTHICEVCHTVTSVHRYNTAGQTDLNHQGANNTDCIACHSHSKAFGASCTACHGDDVASGTPITTGKHSAHINPGVNVSLGTALGCAECHSKTVNSNTTVSTPANHRNGYVDYSGVRAGGSASLNTVTGVCSNAYCHTDGKGRQNVPFTSANGWVSSATIADCKGCHGNDTAAGSVVSSYGEPNYSNAGAGAPRANSHKTTNNRHVTSAADCGDCHSATTTTGTAITGTVHVNGAIDLAPGNANTFGWTGSTKTCSNISCHSLTGPADAFTASPVQWGTTASCILCHGGDATTPSSITTGKHTAHTNNASTLGTNYGCLDCHAKTVSANTSISTATNHMNGFVDYSGVKAGKSSTYLSSTGNCSSAYCHTDGKGRQNVPFTTTNGWRSSATLDCKGCHGNDTNAGSVPGNYGEPNYSNAGAGATRANSHKTTNNRHVTAASDCVNCHSATTTTGTSLLAGGTHLDGSITVVQGNGKSFTWTAGTKTCSNISCHGMTGPADAFAGAPVQWGTASSCTICHGGDATTTAPISTGKHTAHTNNAAALGTNYGCLDCHAKTVSSNTAIGTAANHMNGFVDYSGAKAGKSSTYLSATGNCSNAYCHTDGKGTQSVAFTTANGWRSTVTLDCRGCHGNDQNAGSFASAAGEPNYSNAGSGAPRANSHQKHVKTVGASTCVSCHSATTSTGTTIVGSHTNGTIDLAQGNGKTFTWTAGTKTCSNISCHFSATAVWGATLGCAGCHGSDMASGTPISTNKHSAHINTSVNVSLGVALGCVECHAKTVSDNSTVSNTNNHGNGFVDYSGVKAGKSTTYTSSNGVCSSAYCHSDGKGKQNVAFTSANGWKSTATLDCKGCHGNDNAAGSFTSQFGEPNYSNAGANVLRSNSHTTKHISAATACGNCHAQTTSTGTSITGTSHVSQTINPVAGNGKAFTWTAGTKTCSNISCHSLTGVFTAPNVQWGAAYSCTMCHGGDASSSTPITLGKHTAHTNNAAVLGTNFGCIECHAKTVSNNTTISNSANHANGYLNYSGAKAGKSYTSTTGVCSAVYCHTDGKGKQNVAFTSTNGWSSAATLDCKGCHGNDNAAGSFTSLAGEPNYSNAGSGQPRANNHQKHVTTGASDCQNCHSTTTTNGTTLLASGGHLGGSISLAAGNSKTFTWTAGTKTCSTISCHGNSNAVWGAALNCQDCHGNGTTASSFDYGATFWNNGTASKIKTAGTNTGWASRGHGRAFKNYSNSGNAPANFGVETKMCEFCHDATVGHNQASNPFRLKNYSTAGWGRNGICQSCHASGSTGITVGATTKNRTNSPAISSDHNGADHTSSLSGGQFCWDCHNPHGDSNVYMIRDKVAQVSDRVTSAPTTQAATTVVFHNATTGTDFAKSASPYNGICNVCHTTTSHYTQTAGDSHNSTTNCTYCHKHNGTSGSTAFGASGDCLSCHATAQGARRAITPELGSATTYKSHHVTGVAITKWQCILCHAEGDWSTGGVSTLHTGTSGQPIYLRNVDTPAAAGTNGNAGTNYWAISTSWTNTDYTNLDTFCMKCHDAGGAAGLAVNTTTTGLTLNPGAGSAQALDPFNDTETNGYDQVARTRQTDVDTQFNSTNASHHAVKGQRYTVSTYLFTASKFNTFNTLNGTQVKDTSTLHCHDCHYRDGHGTANSEYMLQNSTGADTLWTTSTYGCVKCHISSYYGTTHTNGNTKDFSTTAGSTGLTARTTGNGNITGIACMNCHNVGATGWAGIHGGGNTYVDGAGATQTTYRFMPGMANSKYEPAGWTTTGAVTTCYTNANTSWTGCNQHSGGVNPGSGNNPRPARPLQY